MFLDISKLCIKSTFNSYVYSIHVYIQIVHVPRDVSAPGWFGREYCALSFALQYSPLSCLLGFFEVVLIVTPVGQLISSVFSHHHPAVLECSAILINFWHSASTFIFGQSFLGSLQYQQTLACLIVRRGLPPSPPPPSC